MLIYHPAFDLHHCVFRMIRLLNRLPPDQYHVQRMRILDFYLLFPGQISSMRFPRDLQEERKRFKGHADKYERIVDPYRIFLRLEPFQTEALGCLASRDLIKPSTLLEGLVQRTSQEIPSKLRAAAEASDRRFPDAIDLLTGPMMGIQLYGRDGLKGRTGLFEYRYDPV